MIFFFQAEDGKQDLVRARGRGVVYKKKSRTARGGGVYGVTLLGHLTTSSTWVTQIWASTWATRTWASSSLLAKRVSFRGRTAALSEICGRITSA